MAEMTVVKTLQSFVMDRNTAMQVPSFRIHEYIAKKTTAVNMRVMLEPGKQSGNEWTPNGLPIEVPNSSVMVGTLLPETDDECRIVAQVTVTEERVFAPEQKMTLADFVVLTLNTWEGLLRNIESLGVRHSAVGKEVLSAMELLKDTFSFQELGVSADTMSDLLTIHKLEDIQG